MVDEFAHTNVPGSERLKRWQDVHALLDAGIDVLTTMNVQHLESLNDQVWHVTGMRVRETVPDWVVDEADEVVLVDLTPRRAAQPPGARRGLCAGKGRSRPWRISSPRPTSRRCARWPCGTPPTRWKRSWHGAGLRRRRWPAARPAAGRERILICLTGRPSSAILIRRGKRVADYLQADCLAIHVAPPIRRNGPPNREAVERHMNFARNLRIQTHIVEAADVPRAITEFARAQRITQILMGRSQPSPWWRRFRYSTVQQVVRQARDMQITIVAERRR